MAFFKEQLGNSLVDWRENESPWWRSREEGWGGWEEGGDPRGISEKCTHNLKIMILCLVTGLQHWQGRKIVKVIVIATTSVYRAFTVCLALFYDFEGSIFEYGGNRYDSHFMGETLTPERSSGLSELTQLEVGVGSGAGLQHQPCALEERWWVQSGSPGIRVKSKPSIPYEEIAVNSHAKGLRDKHTKHWTRAKDHSW